MPRSEELITMRGALRAADLLWTYIRLGYAPDVVACAGTVSALLDVPAKVASLTASGLRVRNPWRIRQERTQELDPASREPRDNLPRWLDIVQRMAALGDKAPFLPFVNLMDVATEERFYANNAFTAAAVDSSERLSYRWFRHQEGSGELNVRILPRSLDLSPAGASSILHGLQGFAWRTPFDSDAPYLHAQGTVGSSDVRVIGPADGILEAVIMSAGPSEAASVMGILVRALAEVATPLPPGGVTELIRGRLRPDHLMQSPSRPSFWTLNSGPPESDPHRL